MEKTTLEALDWSVSKGEQGLNSSLFSILNSRLSGIDQVTANQKMAPHRVIISIRRRFQFSSALKRMSTISLLPAGKVLVAVKGAPETIKSMLSTVPEDYDETFRWYTRRGSRVLALGMKELPSMGTEKVTSYFHRRMFSLTMSPRFNISRESELNLDSILSDSWSFIAHLKRMLSRH